MKQQKLQRLAAEGARLLREGLQGARGAHAAAKQQGRSGRPIPACGIAFVHARETGLEQVDASQFASGLQRTRAQQIARVLDREGEHRTRVDLMQRAGRDAEPALGGIGRGEQLCDQAA